MTADMTLQKLDPIFSALGKHPLMHALPIYIEHHTQDEIMVRNGTISFIDRGDYIIGVTCQHIIQDYRQKAAESNAWKLYIRNTHIDLKHHLKDQNERLDLATLIFTKSEFKQLISESKRKFGSLLIKDIYCGEIQPNQLVFIGGFPEEWRETTEHSTTSVSSALIGEVYRAEPERFICKLEKVNNMHRAFDNTGKPLREFSGFSGGPVFIETVSDSGMWHLEFVGIVYEGGPEKLEGKDILTFCITRTKFIRTNGSIEKFLGY